MGVPLCWPYGIGSVSFSGFKREYWPVISISRHGPLVDRLDGMIKERHDLARIPSGRKRRLGSSVYLSVNDDDGMGPRG